MAERERRDVQQVADVTCQPRNGRGPERYQPVEQPKPEPLTVYYDASCPLCTSEMWAIKSHDAACLLTMVDCSGANGLLEPSDGVTTEGMMRALHARTADGRWLVGVPAYAAIFCAAGCPRLARLAAHPRLRPLWNRIYAWVARNRHRLPRRGLARLLDLAARRDARAS